MLLFLNCQENSTLAFCRTPSIRNIYLHIPLIIVAPENHYKKTMKFYYALFYRNKLKAVRNIKISINLKRVTNFEKLLKQHLISNRSKQTVQRSKIASKAMSLPFASQR